MKAGPLGCIIEQEYTEGTCQALSDRGEQPMFASTGIEGRWQGLVDRGVTGVYLWADEHERLGAPGADYQKRGTCFPAGTEVMTKEGIPLAIEQLRVGDEVLTHRGRFRKVLACGARPYSEAMVSVRTHRPTETERLLDCVVSTPDHEYCVLADASDHIDSCEWVAAKDLQKGQLIVTPVPGGHQVTPVHSTRHIPLAVQIDVYNIDVEEDESYVVEGLAVHNCVGRGTYRAMQQSYHYAITSGTEIGQPTKLAYEPIYIGSREVIGGGRLNGDGSVGAWAAEWGDGYGAVPRRRYNTVDLSRNNETFATDVRRVPKDIIDEGKKHTFAAHLCKSFDEICDALASGFAIARCHNTLYGSRDGNGEATPRSSGAHCQAIVGVYLRPDGSTGIIEQQSWGANNPSGPAVLNTKGGPVNLPAGCYGITEKSFRSAVVNTKWWEAWAFSLRKGQGYRDLKGQS